MCTIFVLAHFDDEYCALPLIMAAQAAGEACWFLYVADYRRPSVAARRWNESRAFLRRFGIPADRVLHAGAGSGAFDGDVCEQLEAALSALRKTISALPACRRLVTPAWEGGHPDHDACAALATVLAAESGGAEVIQFGLYNAWRMPRPLLRACSPLPLNGPEVRVPLSWRAWLAWMAAVRFFPSQTWNWLGLWPAMFLTFARRGGFAVQRLDSARIRARPHPGRLHYEWMFRTPYSRVRVAVDGLLDQIEGRATIRNSPASIRT